jgi:hypothetical protein
MRIERFQNRVEISSLFGQRRYVWVSKKAHAAVLLWLHRQSHPRTTAASRVAFGAPASRILQTRNSVYELFH